MITDFIDGPEPMEFPAGTHCYVPPITLMATANLGTEDAILIGSFNQPPGTPLTTIRKSGRLGD
jgi:hypothetical protein